MPVCFEIISSDLFFINDHLVLFFRRGEGPQLVDHRVNCIFQFENLAFDVDGELSLKRSPLATAVATPAMLRLPAR